MTKKVILEGLDEVPEFNIYEDRIYYSQKLKLYSVKLDGTDNKFIREFTIDNSAIDGGIGNIFVTKNKVAVEVLQWWTRDSQADIRLVFMNK